MKSLIDRPLLGATGDAYCSNVLTAA